LLDYKYKINFFAALIKTYVNKTANNEHKPIVCLQNYKEGEMTHEPIPYMEKSNLRFCFQRSEQL